MKLVALIIARRDCTLNVARGMYWAVSNDAEFLECGCPKDPIGGFEIEAFEELTGLRLEPGEDLRLALAAYEAPPERGFGEQAGPKRDETPTE